MPPQRNFQGKHFQDYPIELSTQLDSWQALHRYRLELPQIMGRRR
jgi:hypothetical protein